MIDFSQQLLRNQAMVRPKEYDRESVLDAAVATFWSLGFGGTTMRDLARNCRITSRTMYDAFHDKDRFFNEALDRYQTVVLSPVLAELESQRGVEGLYRFAAAFGKGSSGNGCLFVNTTSELHLVRKTAERKVLAYLHRLRHAFRARLAEAKKGGRFQGDPKLGSSQLLAIVCGLIVSARCGTSRQERHAVLLRAIKDIIGS